MIEEEEKGDGAPRSDFGFEVKVVCERKASFFLHDVWPLPNHAVKKFSLEGLG